MKIKPLIFLSLIFVFLISACGGTGTPEPKRLIRAEELADTGLLGRHPIKGVNVENGYQGNFDGGFILFGGGVSGQISPATNYLIEWFPRNNVTITTTIARSKIVTNTVVYTPEHPGPEIEFVFLQSWLEEIPRSDSNRPFYSEDGKKNLNILIESMSSWSGPALVIVNIYISAEDQAGYKQCK